MDPERVKVGASTPERSASLAIRTSTMDLHLSRRPQSKAPLQISSFHDTTRIAYFAWTSSVQWQARSIHRQLNRVRRRQGPMSCHGPCTNNQLCPQPIRRAAAFLGCLRCNGVTVTCCVIPIICIPLLASEPHSLPLLRFAIPLLSP